MRYRHNLSFNRLLTGDMGELMPVGLVEVLPGDMFRHSVSSLVRMSPLAAPVMHSINVRLHCWFAPTRILWEYGVATPGANTFENFITGGPSGTDAQTPPQYTTTADIHNLEDYLGLPRVAGISVSALPIRMYNWIWNQRYRDQDLQTERGAEDVSLANIAWGRDYYTTARPFAQKGPAVTIPIAGQAPVKGLGVQNQTWATGPAGVYETGETAGTTFAKYKDAGDPDGAVNMNLKVEEDPNNAGFPGIYTDLSAATGISVIDLRNASAIQRFQEFRSRYGSRIQEYYKHLGVRALDMRVQEPEYLGGGSQTMAISEVLQTGLSGDQSARFGVADMYGHGISGQRMRPYQRLFQEHGYVMVLMSVRPRAKYLDNIQRHWLRQDKFDYWQKEVEHVGQQPIMNNEVYAVADPSGSETWGYGDRYEEYRYQASEVSNEFRDVLKYWHLGRDFTGPQALNSNFITCKPSKRIYQEQAQHGLWIGVNHALNTRRLVARSARGLLR